MKMFPLTDKYKYKGRISPSNTLKLRHYSIFTDAYVAGRRMGKSIAEGYNRSQMHRSLMSSLTTSPVAEG